MAVYMQQKTLVYMDSLQTSKPPPDKDPKVLLQFLQVFADIDKRPFDITEWKFVSAKPIKQVKFHHSCLMYTHYLVHMFLICFFRLTDTVAASM